MISIGSYPLLLGVERPCAPRWAIPIIDAGRDAAYVDTGYLKALFDDADQYHTVARAHWQTTKAVLYTSSLVLGEVYRQFAKTGRRDQTWRWTCVRTVTQFVMVDRRILVCCPPHDVLERAIKELGEMQESLVRLDLCDSLSMVILDTMRHRRVLSFDDHFRSVGASLEPDLQ